MEDAAEGGACGVRVRFDGVRVFTAGAGAGGRGAMGNCNGWCGWRNERMKRRQNTLLGGVFAAQGEGGNFANVGVGVVECFFQKSEGNWGVCLRSEAFKGKPTLAMFQA